jgi:hypothetical protein
VSVVISTAWDHARIGAASVTVNDNDATFVVTISSGRRAHLAAGTVTVPGSSGLTYATGLESTSFAAALAAALNAEPSTSGVYAVTRSATTGLYTITCNLDFELEFTPQAAAGTRMRQLLGFTGDQMGGGVTTRTSDCVPKYTLIPRNPRTGYVGVPTEGDGVTQWTTSAGGRGGLGPTYLPRKARWEHHFEPQERVWHRKASADTVVGGQQYTWEALSDDAYLGSEVCFAEDSASSGDSLAFYLTSSPVADNLRRQQPEDPRYVVSVDAGVVGIL